MKSIAKKRKPKRKVNAVKIPYNTYAIWISVIFLTAFGLMMIYSASGIQFVNSEKYTSMYLLKKQVRFVLAGFAVCFVCQFINYSVLYKTSKFIYAVGIVSILLLKPFGVSVNGATRWLNIAGIQFQVAELVKICVIIMLAYMVQHYSKYLNKIGLVIRMWMLGGAAAALLLIISNDLSSSIVVLGITFCITFLYTKSEKLHIMIAGSGLAIIGLYVWNLKENLPTAEELETMSFRVARIAAWLDPERYASSHGYQTLQSLYAIGSSNFIGKGLGKSMQKISSIPESQNDMIFSIICEELGIFGAFVLLFLLAYLCYYLCKVIISTKNLFGSVLITGVLVHIALQSFINIAVNINLIPNTGIGLPFISYGGTAIFCQLAEIAMVLSVGRIAKGCKSINLYRILKKDLKRKQAKKRRRVLKKSIS